MNLMKKLLTALRGGAREVGETIIDANSIRIYEQEIADAKQHMREAKENLTTVMAKEMQLKRDMLALEENISTHEGYTREALASDNEALALEIASKIAQFENDLSEHKASQDFLATQTSGLKSQIRQGEKIIAEHERQLSMVKTTDSVQKATITISENISTNSSQLNSAKESLERIRKRQQENTDRLAAEEILAGESQNQNLESKLKAAGIIKENNGASVLERLKNKK